MNASRIKNLLITSICLLLLVPGVILMHGGLPSWLSSHIHSSGFNGELHVFWDAQPYAKGITSYIQGRDPYPLDNPSDILPFAYPPVFLWVGGALARALTSALGWKLYTSLNVISVVLLQVLLSAVFFRRLSKREAIALVVFAPLCLFLTTVFWSGNIHLVWYFAAMVAAIPGLRRNQWLWFYGVTLLATVNQPVFLLMLMLPFFAGTRQLLFCVADVVVITVAYLVERMIDPGLYKAFQATVEQHLQTSHDFGEGVFGMIATGLDGRTHLALKVAAVLQVLFSAAVFFLLLYLRKQGKQDAVRWWGLIAMAIVLVNPRVMPYDAAIGLIPACFFLVSGLRFSVTPVQVGRWALILATVLATLASHRLLGYTLVVFSGFALGSWESATGRWMAFEQKSADATWGDSVLAADHV